MSFKFIYIFIILLYYHTVTLNAYVKYYNKCFHNFAFAFDGVNL